MTTNRRLRPLTALGLGLILVLGFGRPSVAQRPASGSGTGTGTGGESGGLGATGTGGGAPAGGRMTRPGGGSQVPTGPRIEPMERPRVVNPGDVERLFGKDELPVREALEISNPGERALAMVRIARTSIMLQRPDLGHFAIFQAAADSVLEPDSTARDQSIVSTIMVALSLAEEHMRDIIALEPDREPPPAPPAPASPGTPPIAPIPAAQPRPTSDRAANLERGRQEWELAFKLSFEIVNRSTRTETLYRVVESQSLGSSSLVREPVRLLQIRPDPARLSPPIRDFSDRVMKTAIENASQIERPVWRDRAMVSIATNASVSGQFARAIEAARAIPQSEVRVDALLRIAENQSNFGRLDEATATYAEAARTIALVPVVDPRETLVGVLIDSLIANGRFDDARDSVVLYSNPANPAIALSAVAESQGRRNLAGSARQWIDAETDPGLRSLLLRKLNDGILYSVEQRRSSEFSRVPGAGPAPPPE